MYSELRKKLKSELHKVVLVENKILKKENKVLCRTCKKEITIKNTGAYCDSCRADIVARDREKILASKKRWRDKNKAHQKAYRDSIKESRRVYDQLRYESRKNG